jgi:ankyrin repeat protein
MEYNKELTQKLYNIIEDLTATAEEVESLINQGADVNGITYYNKNCNTCFNNSITKEALRLYVFKKAHSEEAPYSQKLKEEVGQYKNIIKLLIEKGADITAPKSEKNEFESYLELAAKSKDLELVQLFIDNGADLNVDIRLLSRELNYDTLKLFADNKVIIDYQYTFENAVIDSKKDIANFALKQGATVNPDLLIPLAANGNIEMMNSIFKLFSYWKNVSSVSNQNDLLYYASQYAINNNDITNIKLLIEHGLNIHKSYDYSNGLSLLHNLKIEISHFNNTDKLPYNLPYSFAEFNKLQLGSLLKSIVESLHKHNIGEIVIDTIDQAKDFAFNNLYYKLENSFNCKESTYEKVGEFLSEANEPYSLCFCLGSDGVCFQAKYGDVNI